MSRSPTGSERRGPGLETEVNKDKERRGIFLCISYGLWIWNGLCSTTFAMLVHSKFLVINWRLVHLSVNLWTWSVQSFILFFSTVNKDTVGLWFIVIISNNKYNHKKVKKNFFIILYYRTIKKKKKIYIYIYIFWFWDVYIYISESEYI